MEVDVSKVDLDNTMFHFTGKENEKSIEKEGLKPLIGDKSQGVEKNKKVFFSYGTGEMLLLVTNSIRIAKDAIENHFKSKKDRNQLIEDYYQRDIKKHKVDRKKSAEENAYSVVYDMFKNSNYYKLDLTGAYTKDFKKMSKKEQEKIDFLYDDIDDETGKKIEKHNMHTRVDKGVEPEKISKLCVGKNDDALSVVKYSYDKFNEKLQKGEVAKKNYIDGDKDTQDYCMRTLEKFFEYVKQKENAKSLKSLGRVIYDVSPDDIDKAERFIEQTKEREQEEIRND